MSNEMLKDSCRSNSGPTASSRPSRLYPIRPAQHGAVALAWLRYRPIPVIPIIGARKLTQLQDNLASFDLTLSADQLTTLDEASRIDLGSARLVYKRSGSCDRLCGLRDRSWHKCILIVVCLTG